MDQKVSSTVAPTVAPIEFSPTEITTIINTIKKSTRILLPIDGFFLKGENTCSMFFTMNSEL
jgi:hypothetical protein